MTMKVSMIIMMTVTMMKRRRSSSKSESENEDENEKVIGSENKDEMKHKGSRETEKIGDEIRQTDSQQVLEPSWRQRETDLDILK